MQVLGLRLAQSGLAAGASLVRVVLVEEAGVPQIPLHQEPF